MDNTPKNKVLNSHELSKSTHKVNVLGHHWSRNNIHSNGTGVFWDKNMNMWEVRVVRTVGHYKTAAEAGEELDAHINGVEEWFIRQIEIAERKLMEHHE